MELYWAGRVPAALGIPAVWGGRHELLNTPHVRLYLMLWGLKGAEWIHLPVKTTCLQVHSITRFLNVYSFEFGNYFLYVTDYKNPSQCQLGYTYVCNHACLGEEDLFLLQQCSRVPFGSCSSFLCIQLSNSLQYTQLKMVSETIPFLLKGRL